MKPPPDHLHHCLCVDRPVWPGTCGCLARQLCESVDDVLGGVRAELSQRVGVLGHGLSVGRGHIVAPLRVLRKKKDIS